MAFIYFKDGRPAPLKYEEYVEYIFIRNRLKKERIPPKFTKDENNDGCKYTE